MSASTVVPAALKALPDYSRHLRSTLRTSAQLDADTGVILTALHQCWSDTLWGSISSMPPLQRRDDVGTSHEVRVWGSMVDVASNRMRCIRQEAVAINAPPSLTSVVSIALSLHLGDVVSMETTLGAMPSSGYGGGGCIVDTDASSISLPPWVSFGGGVTTTCPARLNELLLACRAIWAVCAGHGEDEEQTANTVVYHRTLNPDCPMWSMVEASVMLIAEGSLVHLSYLLTTIDQSLGEDGSTSSLPALRLLVVLVRVCVHAYVLRSTEMTSLGKAFRPILEAPHQVPPGTPLAKAIQLLLHATAA